MGGVMVRARQGLEELYHEQGDRLWWALLAFTGDREIASDAEAEAFAQALRRGDAIRNPHAWIWTAAFRIAAGQFQERRRSEPIVTEPSYEMLEPAAELADALRRLPAQQRTRASRRLRRTSTDRRSVGRHAAVRRSITPVLEAIAVLRRAT